MCGLTILAHVCYIDIMETKMLKEAMDMRIRDLDPELIRRFKILCLMEKKNQTEKIRELIEKAVRDAKLTEA